MTVERPSDGAPRRDLLYAAIDEAYRAVCRVEDELDTGVGELTPAAESYFLRLRERLRDQTHPKFAREKKRRVRAS